MNFKTDNLPLFEYTLEEVFPNQNLADLEFTKDLYNSPLLDLHHKIQTTFEKKYLNNREKINYLRCRLVQRLQFSVYSSQFTVFSLQFSVFSLQFSVFSSQFSVQCFFVIVFIFFTQHSQLNTQHLFTHHSSLVLIYSTLTTQHSTLNTCLPTTQHSTLIHQLLQNVLGCFG